MMPRKTVTGPRLAAPALFLAAGLLLAACGGGSGTPSNTSGGSPSASASGTSVDKTAFKMAFPDHPDVGNLPVVVTLQKMAAQGYNTSYTALSGTTSVVAALLSNDVQVIDLTGPGTFKAIAKGDPFEVFGQQYIDEDALVTSKKINTVAQLAGKKIALASATTLSASLLNTSLKQAGIKPDIVYLGSSPVREGALLAGKVDATILELDDVAKVLTGPDASNFHVLVYYPPLFPFLLGNVFSTTQSFASAHPTVIKALLNTYNQVIAQAYADPNGFITQYGHLLTGLTPSVEKQAMAESVQGKIWGTNHAQITQSDIIESLNFYQNAGLLKKSQVSLLESSESKWLFQG
jgi:ABC-type nitrate/sulfonate/bicarbonate transport system substrate-binding protein